MFEILEAIRGRGPHRQRIPIRRHSRQAGHCEAGFWRPLSRRIARRILEAAKRYNRKHKQPGRKSGPLGHVAIEVMEIFVEQLVDFRTGRLEPSLDYLQRRLSRSRGAIVRALQALRTHGFLDWQRRYEENGEEGRGKPPRQVTNAYRMALPPAAAALLGLFGQDEPLPDDVETERADRAAMVIAAEKAEFDETPLGRSLEQFRQSMVFRKSIGGPETKEV